MILRNSARCPKCGDNPESVNRHDYKSCKCGAIAVDGGFDYLRRTYETGVIPENTTISYPCLATNRQGRRGVICGFYLVYGPDIHGEARYYGTRFYWGWDLETAEPWECPELIDPENLQLPRDFWQERHYDWMDPVDEVLAEEAVAA